MSGHFRGQLPPTTYSHHIHPYQAYQRFRWIFDPVNAPRSSNSRLPFPRRLAVFATSPPLCRNPVLDQIILYLRHLFFTQDFVKLIERLRARYRGRTVANAELNRQARPENALARALCF
jgi:hypothetical protein